MFTWIGKENSEVPILLTVPHSGEQIPPEADWLAKVPPDVLLTDVDRFVNELYASAANSLPLPLLYTKVHRYAVDLNRFPEDIDQESVVSARAAPGSFTKGFHWVRTTKGVPIMRAPIPRKQHDLLVTRYHDAFHATVGEKVLELKKQFPSRDVIHLDCHSMPSVGTGAHRDSGERRADVVISDLKGVSASASIKDAVLEAFKSAGFRIAYNWPYYGGRITERYGKPESGHHTIQIELNRALYMDEVTKKKLPEFDLVSQRLSTALETLVTHLKALGR